MDNELKSLAIHIGQSFGYLLKVLDEINWRLDTAGSELHSDGDLKLLLNDLKEHLGQLGNENKITQNQERE